MKKIALVMLCMVLVFSLLAGCNKKNGGDEIVRKPMVVALEAEPTSLDPFNATDGVSASVQKTMFEGLLTYSEGNEVVPLLAKEWSYNDSVTEITFVLREGVLFHDGAELTAEVVKLNYDFVRNRDNGMVRRSFFSFIDEIIVNSKYSVTIRSKTPNSAMAAYLAHPAAGLKSPLELEKKITDATYNLDRNPVGTGPFKFEEWLAGQHVKVVPNEEYWNQDALAKLESITFKAVVDASTRVNMLKTGEAHFIQPLPTSEADALDNEAGIEVFSGPSMNVFYIGINVSLDKYKDVKVRQAMNHAINKDQLIAQILDGYGRVADSAIAPSVYGYARQTVYAFDVNKAKQLMADAGADEGFEATLWTRNSTEFIAVAEYVKIQLAEIGIEVKIEAYDSGAMFDMLDAGEGTDLWIGRWSPGTGEADWGLRPNFASDRIPPNYNNSGFYVNPALDVLFNEALATPSPVTALQKYADAQRIIYQDAPWVFLHVTDIVVAKRAEAKGIVLTKDGSILLNNAWIE